MALIKTIRGISPVIGKNCYLAETAVLIGEVILGDNCSIWYNTVLRGDVHYITIGNNVNIQDGTIIHGTYKKAPVNIGNNVSVAHRTIIHGCTLHDNVLIGMGAIIMDHAEIRSNSIIAAGSVVLEHTVVEENSLYAGIPAKRIKPIEDTPLKEKIMGTAEHYLKYMEWYRDG